MIVATRANQLMMDNCMKAMAEVKLLEPESVADKISIPNTTINPLEAFAKNNDQISVQNLKTLRQKFS